MTDGAGGRSRRPSLVAPDGPARSAAQGRFLPSFRTWPHRDGGRVVQLYGDTWKLEVSWAHRRRDRYGVRTPFTATLHRYEAAT